MNMSRNILVAYFSASGVTGRVAREIAEATGAEVLDSYFPDNQFATVIHASSKVCEGSWHWQPVATFKPDSRPAKDYEALAEEVLHG